MLGDRSRVLFFCVFALGLAVIWFRPGPWVLRGVDSGCYARVSQELAERPLSDWVRLTIGGKEFFEHPPLAFWVEGLAFRIFGISVGVALAYARAMATLTLLLVGLAGARWGNLAVGAFAMAGLLMLSGFLYQSQVPMLELPLCALSAAGLISLAGRVPPSTGRDSAAFVILGVAGFWVKGPPGLVLLGVLAAVAAVGWVPWRRAVVVGVATLVAVVASVLAFDALRGALGLNPFFRRYLTYQVFTSLTVGRSGASHNLLFYFPPLVSWYLAGLLAVPVAVAFACLHRRVPAFAAFPSPVAFVGGVSWACVVLGFTAATQKADWYIHFGMVGAALLMGAVLYTVLGRFPRAVGAACAVAAVGWLAIWAVRKERPPTEDERRYLVVQNLPFPDPAAHDRTVADCSGWGDDWRLEHLMGFAWHATRVGCTAPAAWRFDGAALSRTR